MLKIEKFRTPRKIWNVLFIHKSGGGIMTFSNGRRGGVLRISAKISTLVVQTNLVAIRFKSFLFLVKFRSRFHQIAPYDKSTIVFLSRVPHLGSEIKFIEDLVDASVLVGEAGHMVTTLSVSIETLSESRGKTLCSTPRVIIFVGHC